MRIHKVHLNNFKVYSGLNSIDCSVANDFEKPLVIIGGPNGAGKTSFLESLKLCFFGSQNKNLLSPFKGHYNQYLKTVHNKDAFKKGLPFSIAVEYSDDRIRDVDIFKVERSWTKKEDASYIEDLTLYANNQIRNDIAKSDFQLEINENFPIGVSELLFFDSEAFNKIPDFLENGFISSLNKFMGISLYNQLNNDLFQVKKNQLSSDDEELNKKFEEQSIKRKSLENEKEEISQKIKSIRSERIDSSSKIESLKKELSKQSSDLSIRQSELDKETIRIDQYSKATGDEYRRIYAEVMPFYIAEKLCKKFISRIDEEKDIKNRKIVASKIQSMEKKFFNSMDSIVNKQQKEKLKKSWDDLKGSRTNKKVLHDLSDSKGSEIKSYLNNIFKTAKKIIEKNKIDKKRVRTDRHNLKKKRDIFDPHGPGAKIYNQLNQLSTMLGELREKEANLGEKLNEIDKKIDYEILQEKILINKKTKSDAISSKADLINKSIKMLDKFSEELTLARFKKLRVVFIETYKALSTKKDKINDLQFNRDLKKLEFLDENGNKLGFKDFSAGESEIAIFSLLWAVNESADTRYPIVTDSPFNRLDSEHRDRFINEILKKSKSQIIFLSTNEEISNIEQFGLSEFVTSTYLIDHSIKNASSTFKESYFN